MYPMNFNQYSQFGMMDMSDMSGMIGSNPYSSLGGMSNPFSMGMDDMGLFNVNQYNVNQYNFGPQSPSLWGMQGGGFPQGGGCHNHRSSGLGDFLGAFALGGIFGGVFGAIATKGAQDASKVDNNSGKPSGAAAPVTNPSSETPAPAAPAAPAVKPLSEPVAKSVKAASDAVNDATSDLQAAITKAEAAKDPSKPASWSHVQGEVKDAEKVLAKNQAELDKSSAILANTSATVAGITAKQEPIAQQTHALDDQISAKVKKPLVDQAQADLDKAKQSAGADFDKKKAQIEGDKKLDEKAKAQKLADAKAEYDAKIANAQKIYDAALKVAEDKFKQAKDNDPTRKQYEAQWIQLEKEKAPLATIQDEQTKKQAAIQAANGRLQEQMQIAKDKYRSYTGQDMP